MLSTADASVLVAAIGAVAGTVGAIISAHANSRVAAVGDRVASVEKGQGVLVGAVAETQSGVERAVAQTAATGNGHAGRVEGGITEVLDRLGRIESAATTSAEDVRQLREAVAGVRTSVGAELRGMRADVAAVQQAITTHLNSHADADVRRAG